MTLPGFTAEAATGPSGVYATGALAPAASPGLVAAAFGPIAFIVRCCRRAPLLGNRFVCVQRRRLPWESCTCFATQTGPVISCKDNGNYPTFEQA
jgi:hypothetical protein